MSLETPPRKYRIAMSTKAAKMLDDHDLRKMARNLNHREETSCRYYEFADTRDATYAHKKIKILSKQRYNRQSQYDSSDSLTDADE